MSYTRSHSVVVSWGVALGLGLFLWLCLTPIAYAADIIVNATDDNTIAGDGFWWCRHESDFRHFFMRSCVYAQ